MGGSNEDLSSKLQVQISAKPNPEIIAHLKQFEAQRSSDDAQSRARCTLQALNQMARYLAGLLGRKNLIWFSGSFPINILPDGSLVDTFANIPNSTADPFAAVANYSEEFRETTELLARSQVAVYPIDARGLDASAAYSVEESGAQYDEQRL